MGRAPLSGAAGAACVCVLLCGIACGGWDSQQTSHLTAYELTIPRRIERQRRNVESVASSQVSYIIRIQGKDHVIVLEKNEHLLPEDFTVYSYAEDGSLVTEQPRLQEHCHFQGYVEDLPGSSVALSICSGLRGVLQMGNVTYGIEPLESSTSFQHLAYRLEDISMERLECGTPHTEPGPPHYAQALPISRALRTKRAILHQTHFVELLLVVDNERFVYMNRNQTAVRDAMVQLANYVDSMYAPLNIRVVLVGLEIWSQRNLISTDGGAGEVLARFVQWREQMLGSRRRHDSAQLVLRRSFGGTAGMAFVSAVCSRSHGGGISAYTGSSMLVLASIVAHELGHNLGMNHDDGRACHCGATRCIMNSGTTGSRNFSSCSSDDFEKLILSGGGSCLLNVPRPDEAYSTPYCGNKVLDVGEECDCGSDKECESDPCCEARTCRLRQGAQCADGVCCKNCQFLPAGAVCRPTRDECDLPEYCNGSSPVCQNDVFKQNGHPCWAERAYCYNGQCQHYDAQCQAIFGSKAKAAPEVCFRAVNFKGDRFGNCGYQGLGYRKCEIRNAMCGKLQCENVQTVTVFGIEPSVIQTPIAGTKCWGVDFMLGSDVPDPGMVNEGTRCGENMVCANYQCVSADVLKYDCDVGNKCNGHGVCNSNKNCHCDSGWAPPTCEVRGYGGSVDSGPAWNENDTTLRDGLLIFFFAVLPPLALVLYMFFMRNQLRQRFYPKKRSQGYEADCRPQSNSWQEPSRTGGLSHTSKEGVGQASRTSSTLTRAAKPPLPPLPSLPPQPGGSSTSNLPDVIRPAAAPKLVPQRPAPPPPV